MRLQDVKDYRNSLEPVQVKFKEEKYNSFVSSGAKFELGVDIVYVLARDGGDCIQYGFCAFDNFTKRSVSYLLTIENHQS